MTTNGAGAGGGGAATAPPPSSIVEFRENQRENSTYLKSYWRKLDYAITNDRDNPTAHLASVRQHKAAAYDKPESRFAAVFFAELPRVVRTLLERSYPYIEWLDDAMAFLEEVMSDVVRGVLEGGNAESLFVIIEPIFVKGQDFYGVHGRGDDGPQPRAEYNPSEDEVVEGELDEAALDDPLATTERWSYIAADDAKTSTFYAGFIDKFGELGGFKILLDITETRGEDRASSKTIFAFLKLIESMYHDLKPKFIASYVAALDSRITAYVESFTDQELRDENLEAMLKSISSVAKLATKVGLPKTAERLEIFKLQMAFKYVQLPFLEASLKGIEQITGIIAAATGDASYSSASSSRGRGGRYGGGGGLSALAEYFNYETGGGAYGAGVSRSRYGRGTGSSGGSGAGASVGSQAAAAAAAKGKGAAGVGSSSAGDLATASGAGGGAGVGAGDKPKVPPKPTSIITVPFLLEWIANNDIIAIIFKLEHPEALRQCTQIIRFVAKEQSLSQELLNTIWGASKLHESLQIVVFQLIETLLDSIPRDQIDYLYDQILALPTTAYNNQVLTFISNFTKNAIKVAAEREEEARPYGLDLFWKLLRESEENNTSDAIVTETCDHLQNLLKENPTYREEFMIRFIQNVRDGVIVTVSLRMLTTIMRTTIMTYPAAEVAPAVQSLDETHHLIDSIVDDIARCASEDDPAAAVQSRLDFLEFLLTESPLMVTLDQAKRLWANVLAAGQQDLAFSWMERLQYAHLDVDPYGPKVVKYPAFSPEVIEVLYTENMVTLDVAAFTASSISMYWRSFISVNAKNKAIRRLGGDEVCVRSVDLVGLDKFIEVALTADDNRVGEGALKHVAGVFGSVITKALGELRAKRAAVVRRAIESVFDSVAAAEAADGAESAKVALARVRRGLSLISTYVSEDVVVPDAALGDDAAVAAAGPRCGDVLTSEYFDKLVGLLLNTDVRDAVWAILMLIPSPPDLAAMIDDLTVDPAASADSPAGSLALASYIGAKAEESTYVYTLLYILQIVRRKVLDETWRAAFIEAGGVKFLVHLFTTQDLMREDVGEYGKLAAANLVEAINDLFTSGGLSPERLAESLDGKFIHRLMEQIAQLATLRGGDDAGDDADADGAADDDEDAEEAVPTRGSARKGKYIANCHYSSGRHFLGFAVKGKRFQVAIYCIDYNTTSRVQNVTLILGDDSSIANPPGKDELHPKAVEFKGSDFHNGMWVVWDCVVPDDYEGDCPVTLAIENSRGPNWTLSAFLVDRSPGIAPDPIPGDDSWRLPEAIHIDRAKLRGRWRGNYGSCGGVLLGIKDYVVPARPDMPPDAPVFEAWDTGSVDRYEWIRALTNDTRALDQVPREDEMDFFSEEDEVLEFAPLVSAREAAAAAAATASTPTATTPSAATATEGAEGAEGADAEAADGGDAEGEGEGEAEAAAAASPEEPEDTNRALLDMLVAIVTGKDDLRAALLGYEPIVDWLYTVLIECTELSMRKALVDGITKLAKEDAKTHSFFLTTLIDFLPRIAADPSLGQATQFFYALRYLIVFPAEGADLPYEAAALANTVSDLIVSRDILEDEDELDKVDTILVGLLDTLTAVVTVHKELKGEIGSPSGRGMVDVVFGPCLFASPESRTAPNYPKCKTVAAREAGFNLLSILTEGSDEAKGPLVDRVVEYMNSVALPSERDWTISVIPASGSDEDGGRETRGRYVGLKNQGCTCYMNATLQQLFIIPKLRRDILTVEVQIPEEEVAAAEAEAAAAAADAAAAAAAGEGGDAAAGAVVAAIPPPKKADILESNVMYQIQNLFAYMQESKSAWVDTINFCKTVRLNGGPINVRQQEDANEFFNALADQLERYIKGTPQETMFRDTFGGTFLHQIVSQDCEHTSERAEDFLTVSIKVQSKRNVRESMEFFVEGDMLDGNNKYYCDQCETEVVAKKRCVLQHLPNILILHLTRFEFDFQTFQNVKVNDKFEFPETLDLKDFTKEGLAQAEGRDFNADELRPDDYYEYDLAGVLVHSGTANAGHYYSYIRDRDPTTGRPLPTWFEFNDRSVTPFDPADVAAQTFGGKYSEMSNHQKFYSGYMLFYDRKVKYKAGVYEKEPLAETPGPGSSAFPAGDGEAADVEPAILNKVWQDSVASAQKRHLLTKPTLNFMWDVILSGGPPAPVTEYRELTEADEASAEVRSLKLATSFLFDVLAHVDDSEEAGMHLATRFADLADRYAAHIPCCRWLLFTLGSDECNWMKKVLLLCPDLDIRVAASALISSVIEAVAPHEKELYFAEPPAGADAATSPSSIVTFVNQLIMLLHTAVAKPALKIQQLLRTLLNFAKVGVEERRVLMARNAVTDLIALYESQRNPINLLRPGQGQFEDLIELLAVLATGCDNPHHLAAAGSPGVPEPTGIELSQAALTKLFSRAFLSSVLRQRVYTEPMLRIFEHWCYGNEALSKSIIDIAVAGADSNTIRDSRLVYFSILDRLLNIEDASAQFRLEMVTKCVMDRILSNMRLPHFRDAYILFVIEQSTRREDVREFFRTSDRWCGMIRTQPMLARWIERSELARFVSLFPEHQEILKLGTDESCAGAVTARPAAHRPAAVPGASLRNVPGGGAIVPVDDKKDAATGGDDAAAEGGDAAPTTTSTASGPDDEVADPEDAAVDGNGVDSLD